MFSKLSAATVLALPLLAQGQASYTSYKEIPAEYQLTDDSAAQLVAAGFAGLEVKWQNSDFVNCVIIINPTDNSQGCETGLYKCRQQCGQNYPTDGTCSNANKAENSDGCYSPDEAIAAGFIQAVVPVAAATTAADFADSVATADSAVIADLPFGTAAGTIKATPPMTGTAPEAGTIVSPDISNQNPGDLTIDTLNAFDGTGLTDDQIAALLNGAGAAAPAAAAPADPAAAAANGPGPGSGPGLEGGEDPPAQCTSENIVCDATGTVSTEDGGIQVVGFPPDDCQCVCKSGYSEVKCDDDSVFASYLLFCGGDSDLATTYADSMAVMDPTAESWIEANQVATELCRAAAAGDDDDDAATTAAPAAGDDDDDDDDAMTCSYGTSGAPDTVACDTTGTLPTDDGSYKVDDACECECQPYYQGPLCDVLNPKVTSLIENCGDDPALTIAYLVADDAWGGDESNTELEAARQAAMDACNAATAAADAAPCDEVSVACCKEHLESAVLALDDLPFLNAMDVAFAAERVANNPDGCTAPVLNPIQANEQGNVCVIAIRDRVSADGRLPQCKLLDADGNDLQSYEILSHVMKASELGCTAR